MILLGLCDRLYLLNDLQDIAFFPHRVGQQVLPNTIIGVLDLAGVLGWIYTGNFIAFVVILVAILLSQ